MHAYLAKTALNPPTNRVPWYRFAVPCYASLFLWVGFYESLAQGTIDRASLGLLFFGLLMAGGLSYALFYHVPATMGMQAGYPLGVIGSSTFGSKGTRFVPGLLAGILQVGWFGVATFYAAKLILTGLGLRDGPQSAAFIAVAVVWGCAFGYVGTKGIRAVSSIAMYIGIVPAITLVVILFGSREGLPMHRLETPEPYAAFVYTIHVVTAFFAVAGALSPGMGLHAASRRDVRLGGLIGVWVPAVFAGGAAMVAVAGARALNPGMEGYSYIAAAQSLGGSFTVAVPWLLLVSSIPASCLFASMASDSFSVVLPNVGRLPAAMGVATLGIVLAVSGIPGDLPTFITIAGALCAPLCGIMAADYWSHDKRWPHARHGVNYAGYGAWVLGFLTGIVPLLPIPEHFQPIAHPAAVYSWIVGFVGYVVLGNLGLKPYQKHRRRRVPLNSRDDVSEHVSTRKHKKSSHHS